MLAISTRQNGRIRPKFRPWKMQVMNEISLSFIPKM
jgi:hypothetical protein